MDEQESTEFMDDDSNDGNSPAPDGDPSTIEEPSGTQTIDPIEITTNTKTLGQPLSDFLMTLEDYTPTVICIAICTISVT